MVIGAGAASRDIDVEGIQSIDKHALEAGRGKVQDKTQCSGKDAGCLVGLLLLLQCLWPWRCNIEMHVASRRLARVETANAEILGKTSKIEMIRETRLNVTEEGVFLEFELGSVRVESWHGIFVSLGIGLAGKDK